MQQVRVRFVQIHRGSSDPCLVYFVTLVLCWKRITHCCHLYVRTIRGLQDQRTPLGDKAVANLSLEPGRCTISHDRVFLQYASIKPDTR